MKIFEYYINLDERGEFYADIRDKSEKSVVEIDTDYAHFLSDERVNLKNVTQIRDYFRSIGLLPNDAILVKGNFK
jgi:sulfur relay (sulfurtransferase) DsrC/TusE family protein